jgi:hypothetical protein
MEGNWRDELSDEAAELIRLYAAENSIKKFHEELLNRFLAWFYLLNIKWAVEKLLLIFTEVCCLVILWKADFTASIPVLFKVIFSLSIHTLFGFPYKLWDYKRGTEVANTFNKLCERYPDYYILEEDANNGRDQGQQL